MLYQWIVFLHVFGTFGFLMAHGGSMTAAFRLRKERTLERVQAVLEFSSASFNVMYISLLLLLIAGIVTGFMGHWWAEGWIWTAIVVLLGTAIAMFIFATGYFNKLRRAAGMPWFDVKGPHPAETPVSQDQLLSLQDAGRPMLLAVLGVLPVALILWLMMFKPF